MYCRAGVLRDGDNEYTPGTKKCQLLTVKKFIFFLLFFDFFYLFLHPFLTKNSTAENVRKRKNRAEGGTAGSAVRGNYACAGMKRCDPQGSRTAADGKTARDKKKLLRAAEKLSDGKNCGCAGGPSLWRAVEHRWVIFVCALLFCILRFRMFFNKSIFAFFYFFIITGNFLDD